MDLADANPPHVLAVDDDELMLAIVRLALTRAGFVVETAGNAATGLQAVAASDPDVVLLDVSLPDLTGWETVRRIRELSDVPVMFVSGRAEDVDKARGLDLGADDYLAKPFSMLELEARVYALLRRSNRKVRSDVR